MIYLWLGYTTTLSREEVEATTLSYTLQHVLTQKIIVIYIEGDVKIVINAFNHENWSLINLNSQVVLKESIKYLGHFYMLFMQRIPRELNTQEHNFITWARHRGLIGNIPNHSLLITIYELHSRDNDKIDLSILLCKKKINAFKSNTNHNKLKLFFFMRCFINFLKFSHWIF